MAVPAVKRWLVSKNLVLVLALIAIPAQAAFLRNVPQILTQPNGQTIHCFASGDEFHHWLHDANGYPITRDPNTGYFVYAVQSGDMLVSSGYLPGTVDPGRMGLQKGVRISPERLRERRMLIRHGLPVADRVNAAPTVGTINNIVIFIRFSDEPEFADSVSTYDDKFNNAAVGASSMYNYFKEVSYNSLAVSTSFYPTPGATVLSYQDSHPRSYYQPYSVGNPGGYEDDNDAYSRELALLTAAVNAVSSQVPAGLDIDGDDDDKVDNVCFIVSGGPDGWGDLLWPHMSTFSGPYINGKQVWTFNFQLRDYLMTNGVGVLCHEMFHSLGAPDLYHYDDDGIEPAYTWDLMEYNQEPPEHMCAYMKYRYGHWIAAIPEITTSGTYTLNPLTSSTNNCYKIRSLDSTQYFVVEYRRKTGTFESSISGSGLIVCRINPAYEGNADGPPDEVYIYRPNGTTSANGNPASAYFSSGVGRTAINDSTNPSAFLSNGSAGGLNISNIGAAGDSISFQVTLPTVATPTFSPDAGTYSTAQTVTVSCATSGATIRYTTNGSDPTESSTAIVSGGQIAVGRSMTLKAKAWKTDYKPSNVKSAAYALKTSTPSLSPGTGTYFKYQTVTVTCATSGAVIRYTTDGTTPTTSSPTIASGGTIIVRTTKTLKAKAWKTYWSSSDTASAAYDVDRRPHFDINGDGSDDLIGLDPRDRIWYSTNRTSWSGISGRLSSLTLGNFNGDAYDDIAGMNEAGTIYRMTDKVHWTSVAGTMSKLCSGDINGDDMDDLIGINSLGKVWYYPSLGGPWTKVSGSLASACTGDVNGDGKDDIIGANSSGCIYYTTNAENGLSATWNAVPGKLTAMAVGDMDEDGFDDLAGLNSLGDIYLTLDLSNWTKLPGRLVSISCGDVNGDGKDDIIGRNSTNRVYYCTNPTAGSSAVWNFTNGTLISLAIGDFNNDGTDDIAGLGSTGNIFFTTNKSSWTQIPGRLETLFSAR